MQAERIFDRGLNALVAESENRFRREMVEVLEEMGLHTYEAGYGSEAVEIVSSVEIHALVIDVELPDFGGLKAVRVIRTFKDVPPFVLLASEVTRALQREAMESQAVSILQNPGDLLLLSDILQSTLLRSYGGAQDGLLE